MKKSKKNWDRVVDASIPHQIIIPNTYCIFLTKGWPFPMYSACHMCLPRVFCLPDIILRGEFPPPKFTIPSFRLFLELVLLTQPPHST